jgi:hypothetical protein
MARHSGTGDGEQRRELAGAGRAVEQRLKHGEPAFVRQRSKDRFHTSSVPKSLRNEYATRLAPEIPPVAEPFFMAFDAQISFAPVMNADDMRAGVGKAMEAA